MLGPIAPTADGGAPPPGAPGAALPSKYNIKIRQKAYGIKRLDWHFGQALSQNVFDY